LIALVDTPIWSYALRSRNPQFQAHADELIRMIADSEALIIGPIRQEVLSGYSDLKSFEFLENKLSFFDNTPIVNSDYVQAARYSNKCRRKGIQGSPTDFLICAVATRNDVPIFTTDKDFDHYKKRLPIRLYEMTSG